MSDQKPAKRSMEFFASKFTGFGGHGSAGDCRVVVRHHKKTGETFVQIVDDSDGAGLGFELREVPQLIEALSKAYESVQRIAAPGDGR